MPLLPPEECAPAVRLIHDYPASVWLFQLRHLRELIPHLEPRVKAGDLLARGVLHQASRTVSLIHWGYGASFYARASRRDAVVVFWGGRAVGGLGPVAVRAGGIDGVLFWPRFNPALSGA